MKIKINYANNEVSVLFDCYGLEMHGLWHFALFEDGRIDWDGCESMSSGTYIPSDIRREAEKMIREEVTQ